MRCKIMTLYMLQRKSINNNKTYKATECTTNNKSSTKR